MPVSELKWPVESARSSEGILNAPSATPYLHGRHHRSVAGRMLAPCPTRRVRRRHPGRCRRCMARPPFRIRRAAGRFPRLPRHPGRTRPRLEHLGQPRCSSLRPAPRGSDGGPCHQAARVAGGGLPRRRADWPARRRCREDPSRRPRPRRFVHAARCRMAGAIGHRGGGPRWGRPGRAGHAPRPHRYGLCRPLKPRSGRQPDLCGRCRPQ